MEEKTIVVHEYTTKFRAYDVVTQFCLESDNKLEILQSTVADGEVIDQISVEIWPGDYANFLKGLDLAYRSRLTNLESHAAN